MAWPSFLQTYLYTLVSEIDIMVVEYLGFEKSQWISLVQQPLVKLFLFCPAIKLQYLFYDEQNID
jgi:hypothetical protein